MMNDVRNGSQYLCVVLATAIIVGNVTILYVAGECNDLHIVFMFIKL